MSSDANWISDTKDLNPQMDVFILSGAVVS